MNFTFMSTGWNNPAPPLISDKTNKSVISSGKLNQGKTLKSKNGFTVPKF